MGAIFSLEALWRLAQLWFHDRLDPAWRRRTPAEVRAIFGEVGLTDGFWSVEG